MADIYVYNRLAETLRLVHVPGVLYASDPPEEIPPNTTLAWQVEDNGSATYEFSSDDGKQGVVKRFTLVWTFFASVLYCEPRDAADNLNIEIEQRPDGVLCTVSRRRRRVPPPPRHGRLLSRILPITAAVVLLALLGAGLTTLANPFVGHPQGSATRSPTITTTATPTATATATVVSLPPPKLAVSPDSGSKVQCSAAAVSYPAITIKNTGGQTLHWQASAKGPGASLSPTSGALDPGKSATLTVHQPSTAGPAATVSITSDGGSKALAFYCVGNPPPPQPDPQPDPPPPPGPQLAVSPTGVTTVTCTGSSVSYPAVTVRNNGGQTLNWSASATVNGASVAPSSGNLGAGQSQTLSVTQPGPTTTATNVSISSNGGSATVQFTCAPTPTPPHGKLSVNPTSLQLGNFCGQSFSGVTITLSNTGNGSLTWSQPGGSPFALSPSSGQLNAGASVPIQVSGTKQNATQPISWQDGGQGPTQTVSVSATCATQTANLQVSPLQYTDSCSLSPDGYFPSNYLVTVDNTRSNVPVQWQFVATNNDANGIPWASSPVSGTVQAGQTQTFWVLTDNGVCSSSSPSPFVGQATIYLAFPQGGWQPNIGLTDSISHN